jgi:O-glycosyl hydrolase
MRILRDPDGGEAVWLTANGSRVGWVDWNTVLDENGGPNHVGNFCSAPIIADTRNDKLIFQSSYYYLGHFSRFIRSGAQRILCATNRDDLEATALASPDGTLAVIVLNRTIIVARHTKNTLFKASRRNAKPKADGRSQCGRRALARQRTIHGMTWA